MKILIATGLYPPEIGGPATYAHMLETNLPARGFEVTVIPFGWVRHYPKVARHAVYAWKLWTEAKRYDVVYALDPTSVGVAAALVAKLRRKPFLIRLGGDYAWEQGRVRFGLTNTLDEYIETMSEAPIQVRLLARVQTYVCSRAKTVVVPSQYLKKVVEQWGIESKNIRVIYSALYPLQVEQPRDELRSQLSYTTPTIVSSGRLVPWKGFSLLLEVVVALKEKYPELSLIIVGDGEEQEKLEKKAAVLGITDSVRFTGPISKAALGATIKAADVFVLNTAYEGLSHQLLEVMDIGVPIVTTTAGGNTELITNGVNGSLVAFNDKEALVDAIRLILEHADTQQRMIQAARLRSKDFSKERVLDEVVQLLRTTKTHG